MDLVNEIKQLTAELSSSIKLLRQNGIRLAEAERDYKLTLRTEALKFKDGKMPVTLINQIIYGVPEVNRLRFERDVAQTTYDANIEHIQATKLKIRIFEAQLQREWGRND